jgi:hypothetical protein
MIRQIGMNFPVEIMEQSGYRPRRFIAAGGAGIRNHAGFHSQHMFAQAIGFDEFANDVPRLISIHN